MLPTTGLVLGRTPGSRRPVVTGICTKELTKSTSRDERVQGTLLRPDPAGTVIEGFLLLSALSKPDPKENTV